MTDEMTAREEWSGDAATEPRSPQQIADSMESLAEAEELKGRPYTAARCREAAEALRQPWEFIAVERGVRMDEIQARAERAEEERDAAAHACREVVARLEPIQDKRRGWDFGLEIRDALAAARKGIGE